MSAFDKIVEFLKQIFEYLKSEKGHEDVAKIAEVVGIIIRIVGMFSSEPPSNERKREYVYAMTKFLKVIPLSEFEKLVEAKRSGALDKLEDFEMDAAIGVALAEYIQAKPKTVKPLGTRG
jgi:uncharacterized membrane protein YiaA